MGSWFPPHSPLWPPMPFIFLKKILGTKVKIIVQCFLRQNSFLVFLFRNFFIWHLVYLDLFLPPTSHKHLLSLKLSSFLLFELVRVLRFRLK